MFTTVLHNLKSAENAGIIVRTHVAFGGGKLVVVGPEPWRFKRRAQAFSRRLEKVCGITHLATDDAFFAWCEQEGCTPVAVEISPRAQPLPGFPFPKDPAIIVGNEGTGLPREFLDRCPHVVMIPQFGPVECLNAAVSCCMAIYEFSRARPCDYRVEGGKYAVRRSAAAPAPDSE
jgi:23S rRNA (guanosine2251-2'-O)-methyltransferase